PPGPCHHNRAHPVSLYTWCQLQKALFFKEKLLEKVRMKKAGFSTCPRIFKPVFKIFKPVFILYFAA
ncbi:MAG: hypothetical protein Q4D81_11685, partial [Eubacteriales bacterium]|nr:hypothetical protein [Eubacteriales bacterium]